MFWFLIFAGLVLSSPCDMFYDVLAGFPDDVALEDLTAVRLLTSRTRMHPRAPESKRIIGSVLQKRLPLDDFDCLIAA